MFDSHNCFCFFHTRCCCAHLPEWRHGRQGWTLFDVTRALDLESPKWELCQLSVTCYPDSHCDFYIAEMFKALTDGKPVIPRQTWKHQALWSAVAYLVSPRGQARLLDVLWPGGRNGPSFAQLDETYLPVAMPFPTDKRNVADQLIYEASHPNRTFFAARPLFSGDTESSHIHAHHLEMQERSKHWMEKLFAEGKALR